MGAAVLIVEDSAPIREALVELLRMAGCECDTADSGREALAKLRAGFRPSVIVLDLRLPNIDGIDFRRIQRSDPSLASIPVVVHTAYDDLVDALDEPTLHCYRKPLQLDGLLREVVRYCRQAGRS